MFLCFDSCNEAAIFDSFGDINKPRRKFSWFKTYILLEFTLIYLLRKKHFRNVKR